METDAWMQWDSSEGLSGQRCPQGGGEALASYARLESSPLVPKSRQQESALSGGEEVVSTFLQIFVQFHVHHFFFFFFLIIPATSLFESMMFVKLK